MAKLRQWGKIAFSINCVWSTGHLHAKEWIWALTLHYTQKLTQNGFFCLNVRAKNSKTLRENVGVDICDLILGHDFLDMIPKIQTIKETAGKLDFIFLF